MSLLANPPVHHASHSSDATFFSSHSIDRVQQAIVEEESTIDWMLIAHDDPDLQSRLAKAAAMESSGMLTMHQSQWDFQSADLASLLDSAVARSGVRRLWLVGHSEGCDDGPVDDSAQSETGHRLIGAARSMLNKASRAKDDFASKAKSLHQHPAVQQAVDDGDLRVHALFYLAHCKTFLLYNPATHEFRPLA
ncbi:hypothetical protein NZK35_02910 [Stieleria sp. ICT_E10.1]|uniref:hypothetical protein n=1 Tax=Stieleria sedimenti TaxID=2976331 RepID=UPI00217F8047|nr:hypothetical protein [Stieleria sedimenti]MCS7465621.1 hypothetical protein [Stieleria sedimenti]